MKNKQISLGAGLSYLSIGINLLFALLYTPWMIRQIGQSDFALYTLANSMIALLLFDFGLSSATSKFISNYIAEGKQKEANEFLGAIYQLYLFIDILLLAVFVVLYFCLDSIYVNLSPEELSRFKVVYCIAAMYSILNFPFVTLNGILTSYEKFIQLKLADIFYRFLCVGLTVLALSRGMGLFALVSANAVSGLIMIGYKLLTVRNTTPIRPRFRKKGLSFYKSLSSFSFWSTMTSLAYRLIFNITPSILAIVANSAAVAVFGVVTTIEQYVFLISTAINGMFLPRISRIYAGASEETDIMPLMLKVGKFQCALNCIIVAGFYTVGRQFIDLWIGAEYADAYWGVLLVIIPGVFYNSLQIANTAMIVRDKVKYQALTMLSVGLLNVILCAVLSRHHGVIGACMSIFIAYTVRAIVYHSIHARLMGLNMRHFAKECYLKMLIPVGATLVFGKAVNVLIADTGWLTVFIKGTLLLLFYATVTLLFYASGKRRLKS